MEHSANPDLMGWWYMTDPPQSASSLSSWLGGLPLLRKRTIGIRAEPATVAGPTAAEILRRQADARKQARKPVSVVRPSRLQVFAAPNVRARVGKHFLA